MMGQEGKIYYLKNLELALLLAMKGMKELYGIKMKGLENTDQAMVYQVLFGLEKKGFLSLEGKGELILPEVDQILEDIKSAGRILFYWDGDSGHPDQCIYLGKNAVFVSAYGKEGEMNRVESVPMDGVPARVRECGFFLEGAGFEREESGKAGVGETEVEDLRIKRKAERLFCESLAKWENGGRWENWKGLKECMWMFSLESRKCVGQYLLLSDKLKDYFVVTVEGATRIFTYSEKKVMEILGDEIVVKDAELE